MTINPNEIEKNIEALSHCFDQASRHIGIRADVLKALYRNGIFRLTTLTNLDGEVCYDPKGHAAEDLRRAITSAMHAKGVVGVAMEDCEKHGVCAFNPQTLEIIPIKKKHPSRIP